MGTSMLTTLDWVAIGDDLDGHGFAVTPPLLTADECDGLSAGFDDPSLWRSTVVMARHGYGQGVYRYFADPLPPLVAGLRAGLYPPLAAIANRWVRQLGGTPWPEQHHDLRAR